MRTDQRIRPKRGRVVAKLRRVVRQADEDEDEPIVLGSVADKPQSQG